MRRELKPPKLQGGSLPSFKKTIVVAHSQRESVVFIKDELLLLKFWRLFCVLLKGVELDYFTSMYFDTL